MRDEITFFHNPMSRARIAHFMLEEVGAPYRIELLDFARDEHKSKAFLAINPMGKVPTIIHGGVVVTEAAAICAYLADAFPEAKLAPSVDDPARGTYLRWLFFFMSKALAPRPRFQRYLERIRERPAYERFTAQDDAFAERVASEGASRSTNDGTKRTRASRPARHA